MLESLLSENRGAVLKRWFRLILETYPPDAARLLQRNEDRFANPVAYTISEGTEAIYDGLVQGVEPDRLSEPLDDIIKIRAVQDFPPSQAVGFVFLLKRAIREELADDVREHQLYRQMLEFESRVDAAVQVAFDMYMRRRQKIYEIRVNEIRGRSARLLERLSLTYEGQEEESLSTSQPEMSHETGNVTR